MGSKNRIAKYILPIMLKEMQDKGYTTWESTSYTKAS